MVRSLLLVSLAIAVQLAAARPARACQPEGNSDFLIDPSQRANDQVAPGKPIIEQVRMSRGWHMDFTSCRGFAHIGVHVQGADSLRATASTGYLVEVIDGAAPSRVPETAVTGHHGILLGWRETVEDPSPYEFTVRVRAVDWAGNVGEPSDPLVIRDAGLKGGSVPFVPLDAALAACARLDGDACVWAGKRYAHGFGAPRDVGRANALYRIACVLGSPDGCELIGNLGRAVMGFERRCWAGRGDACLTAGLMYEQGAIVRNLRRRARVFLELACQADSRDCWRVYVPYVDPPFALPPRDADTGASWPVAVALGVKGRTLVIAAIAALAALLYVVARRRRKP